MLTINHKGKTLKTRVFKEELSDEFCDIIREELFRKPSKGDVDAELKSIFNGANKHPKIERYYFRDIMYKTKVHYSKWSIEEFMECNDLIRHSFGRISSNSKLYYSDDDLVNLEKFFSLGGKGVATKPTNFPIKTADEIIKMYNKNGNYYDYSCGWGVRMLSAMRNGVNYFGTDPNYLLTERLDELKDDYKRVNGLNTKVDIRTQGSEVFIEEWRNSMGLAFSSPPYFALEDYRVGEQSYKDGVTYDEWLDGYFDGTIRNIREYLIDDGYLILNIKNYDKYDLISDCIKVCERYGFKLINIHNLKNVQRITCKGDLKDNSEGLYVFVK